MDLFNLPSDVQAAFKWYELFTKLVNPTPWELKVKGKAAKIIDEYFSRSLPEVEVDGAV